MSPTRFRCANSLNSYDRVATRRDERAVAPHHRPVLIASGSCSVTVITGDSESLNPGSIPGRTLRAGASHVVFLGGLGLRKNGIGPLASVFCTAAPQTRPPVG